MMAEEEDFFPELSGKKPRVEIGEPDFFPELSGPKEGEKREHGQTGYATLNPITNYAEMNREAREQMARGVSQLREPTGGDLPASVGATLSGLGNLAGGAASYVASPINAAIRSAVGVPVQNLTGIPKEYTEFATSMAMPIPKRIPAVPVRAAPATAYEELAQAASRQGVDLPRAAATENPVVQSLASVKDIPVVGAPLISGSKRALEQMDEATARTVAGYGSGEPLIAGNVASKAMEGWVTKSSKDLAEELYRPIEQMVDPTYRRPLFATENAVQDIMSGRAEANLMHVPSRASDLVMPAISDANGMSYEGLKRLRTHLGDMTPDAMVAEGINPQEANKIYRALSQDLRAVVEGGGGPQALAEFDKANNAYARITGIRESLADIIGKKADAAPESIIKQLTAMAGSKKSADFQGLSQARMVMGPDAWDEFASSIINQMGRTTPGADFSAARFKTAWDAMPPRSRNLLFNTTGKPDFAQNIEDIVKLGSAHTQLLKYASNPSGSGRLTALAGMAGGAWAAPLTTLGTAVSLNVMARILASPIAARQAAQWTRTYQYAITNPSPVTMGLLASQANNLAAAIKAETGEDVSPTALMPTKKKNEEGVGLKRGGAVNPRYNLKYHVPTGAIASKKHAGLVYIDPAIPPKFRPFLHTHEMAEKRAMEGGKSYEKAHEEDATPAERAQVERAGLDWTKYTHEMDGYLDHIEHRGSKRLPPDPHVPFATAMKVHRHV